MTTRKKFIRRAIHDKENPYFMVRRATAQDKELSYEARGMLIYILSKPDTWRVQPQDLIRKGCGRDKVYRIIGELIKARYIEHEKSFDEKHRIVWGDYVVHEEPYTPKPDTEIPDTENQEMELAEKPLPENPYTEIPDTENTDSINYRKTENTDLEKTEKRNSAPEPPLEVVQPSKPTPSKPKPKWADEDALIDVWAGIRKLDAISMGADFHTDTDRRKAKTMLAWSKPISADEIREVMKASKYPAYPFAFLEKDVLELRARKAKAPPPVSPPSNGEYIVPLSPAQLREKDAREKAEREKAS